MAFLDTEEQEVYSALEVHDIKDRSHLIWVDDNIAMIAHWLTKEGYSIADIASAGFVDTDNDYTYIEFQCPYQFQVLPKDFSWYDPYTLRSEKIERGSYPKRLMDINDTLISLNNWIVDLKEQPKMYS